ANFTAVDQAQHAPLAKKLFGVPGVQAVMIGTNFVTITKSVGGDWDVLADKVPETIETHLKTGEPVFEREWLEEQTKKVQASTGADAEIERKIREVLDNEIRPAVAMDGGDITFGRYEDGIVYLH